MLKCMYMDSARNKETQEDNNKSEKSGRREAPSVCVCTYVRLYDYVRLYVGRETKRHSESVGEWESAKGRERASEQI